MPVYKNEEKNTWYTSFYYQDWQGNRKRKKKEGFARKKDAQEYERTFKLQQSGSCDMSFGQMTDLYLSDCKICLSTLLQWHRCGNGRMSY